MKKKLIFVLCFLFFFFLSAQNSYETANKNTAIRCLKLAENCLLNGDFENALKQAELGLAYDNNVSDLFYVKAAAEINLNEKKSDVLEEIKKAFECDNWVNYKKNAARILYADLLCDTDDYELSMQILDEEPLIFSADAEFIRIKNLYRIGTENSIENARLKLNSAVRVYPADERFANLFFMFETALFKNAKILNKNYEIPQIVQVISNFYIPKLPDYEGKNPEIELFASFFASEQTKNRLVRAIDSKEQTVHPLMAVAGLQAGLYSQEQAFNLFFETVCDSVLLSDLEYFALQITEPQVETLFIEKLLNFNGTIFIDSDLDLQNEIEINYLSGRPVTIKCDLNNDDNIELYAECDFGSPYFVDFMQDSCKIYYENFPNVSKINFNKENQNATFNFFADDFSFMPFSMKKNSVFEDFGLDFYVPDISKDEFILQYDEFYNKAISVEYPVSERENAKIVYTVSGGENISAVFLQGEKNYAFCNLSKMPFSRFVDFDNDNYFETAEIYDRIGVAESAEEQAQNESLCDDDFILSVFGQNFIKNAQNKIYLKKINIDRNANSFYEFSEEYLPYNGKICYWDNDDNGIIDCKYTRFAQKDGEPLKEESVFYDKDGNVVVIINFIDKIPIKMFEGETEVLINAGKNKNFYWLDNSQSAELEDKILNSVKTSILQGAVTVLELDNLRFSVIKAEENYFCKVLPESEIQNKEVEKSAENSN